MLVLAIVALVLALANRVLAEPLDAIVRDKLAPSLPDGLGIARVYLPAPLATVDTEPGKVVIELPRELRAGRASIKLTYRGHTSWVPVAVAALVEVAVAQRPLGVGEVLGEADFAVERRAIVELTPAQPALLAGATLTASLEPGAPIAARDVSLPPPLPRGSQVEVDVRRGAVHIRGTATLETASRPGQLASARLAATRLVVHGTLVAPATLIVGELP